MAVTSRGIPMWVLVCLMATASACGAGREAGSDAVRAGVGSGKEVEMFRVNAESPSIVVRSTHILHIRVERASPPAWLPLPEGGVGRSVPVTVTLIETLKGLVAETAGDSFSTEIAQYGTGGSRIAAVPGAWSDLPLDPGTEYITFSSSSLGLGAELIRDPWCERVDPAVETLPDVLLALQAEAGNFPPAKVLGLAEASASKLGFVFSEYLWATSAQGILENRKDFDRFLELLELPSLLPLARSLLLDSVYASVSLVPNETWRVSGMVFTFFHLLEIPEAAGLHDNIVSPFLPNLLGLAGGGEKLAADNIFGGHPDERSAARRLLKAYRGESDPTPILEWLE